VAETQPCGRRVLISLEKREESLFAEPYLGKCCFSAFLTAVLPKGLLSKAFLNTALRLGTLAL